MIQLTPKGLYCPAAGAWIDPWRPVPRALITHAHADHARPGSGEYWAVASSEGVLRQRLGQGIALQDVPYGQELQIGEATVSFHSAGHVLGSAQVRISAGDETWLISGDYKRDPDPSCEPFQSVPADVLITEATFGLPVYRWRPGQEVAAEIAAWWKAAPERTSILFCYAFGKAQRLLAELRQLGLADEVLLHGAVQTLMAPYRQQGIAMLPTRPVSELPRSEPLAGRLVLAPPSAHRSVWMKRFKSPQTGFVSGWMAVRGARRRHGYERGFVLSDHADWDGLLATVRQSQAQQVYVTHGQGDVLARYLREVEGISADPLAGGFAAELAGEGEFSDDGETAGAGIDGPVGLV
ncbi:ligase-associated DNA damage response exonuclease [Synechococcus sp. Tobar12-5m-g]|uniref:ligase-associated DNA damage response exonuclease n=1 Tax=unclassified Synechococcus TaxID=2626047 RepID=UPI0020CEDD42|nr:MULTISPECIES: ligase-associated DNA damage response exonuclease [unclassified Synechococcus]MCP9771572.1 ligase-associated DNA damage response exonuclease [Synechococcus sp. Tobar12-5m-g]MCP9872512.1 ligase-associated DNA damage response exonuclease [Synechococcus sp. Cruz CV-v-12]